MTASPHHATMVSRFLMDRDGNISGVEWSERMDCLHIVLWGRYTIPQMQEILRALHAWLGDPGMHFTAKARDEIQGMLRDLELGIAWQEHRARIQRQWNTNEFDHLF